jgi:hypothetical protein
MKTIGSDEIFDHISEFLKAKGIELSAGAYTNRIRKGCTLVTDAINCTQSGLAKAKTGVDKKLDDVRRIIHEKTAPPAPKPDPEAASTASDSPPTSTPTAGEPGVDAPPAAATSEAQAPAADAPAGGTKKRAARVGARRARPARRGAGGKR